MNTNFKYLQKIFFLLVMGFSLCAVQACSSDDEDEDDSSKVLENGNVMINGHEAVDLGLSVKWATCNVGSYTPEGYGEFYAWGETETKSEYTSRTYRWYKHTDEDKTITKYCTDDEYGTVDNRTVLTSSDDVAAVKWGKKWRMPTKEEFDELYTECTWTWTRQNNVSGLIISGPSGRSIFLPAAGYRYESTGSRGELCAYWSATLREDNTSGAYYLQVGAGAGYNDFYDHESDEEWWGYEWGRSLGYSVRPVTE